MIVSLFAMSFNDLCHLRYVTSGALPDPDLPMFANTR